MFPKWTVFVFTESWSRDHKKKSYYGIMMICVASFKLKWYTFETICYLILRRVHAIWPFKYSYGFRLQLGHTERTRLWMDGLNSGSLSCIQHLFFRKERVTGAEMCLAIACGIVTAPDSNWTYFFPCPQWQSHKSLPKITPSICTQ